VGIIDQFDHLVVTAQLAVKLCANVGERKTAVMQVYMGMYERNESSDSSVSIALVYGLDDRCSRVRFQAAAGNFSLHRRVQNGSGVHPASYPMGTRGSLTKGKVAGA
jgi:hypothetical protein